MEKLDLIENIYDYDDDAELYLQRQYRDVMRHKRAVQVLIQKIILVTLCLLLINSIIRTISNVTSNVGGLKAEITSLESKLATANSSIASMKEESSALQEELDKYKALAAQVPDYKAVIDEQAETIETLMTDNSNLAKEYDEVSKAYNNIKTNKALYDKYKYAIVYNGERTELTYDQIKYGEKLMKSYGLNPHIMFSIGMVESKYTENAKNKISTASGYHQFLAGTGEFVYESILNKGSYRHYMALDGNTNIELCAAYLDYLWNTKGRSDIYSTIRSYAGGDSAKARWYIGRMNSYLKQVGLNAYNF